MTPRRDIARIAVSVSLEIVIMLVMNFVNQIIVGGLALAAEHGVTAVPAT